MSCEMTLIAITSGVWAFALASLLLVEVAEAIRGYAQEIGDQLEWHS